MKFWLGLVLGAATCFLFMSHMTVNADGPIGNGDCNGDGKIDLSDAVTLLSYIFADGPEPVPIICQSGKLPATGQSKCYYLLNREIDCNDPDFPGQDGFYQAGCPTEGRFVDNGDGTVMDNCTGLMWQQEKAPGKYSWQEALVYCENLELAGSDDWRLPNVRELQSIVDYGRYDPAIDAIFDSDSSWFWSSTSALHPDSIAWVVIFYLGDVYYETKSFHHSVRAVRH